MTDAIIAVHTYDSHRIKDPQSGEGISAYKLGYSSATAALLLELYGTQARDVSSKQASYRYIHIDGEVVVRHGYLLLALTADELARAERVAREHYRAGVFLWRDQRWLEFPNRHQTDYAEVLSRSDLNFDPSSFRPASPSTGNRDSTVANITVEKSQRGPDEKPWFWLHGDTYPHRDLLKRHGARFSGKRRAWYWIGWDLPDAIHQLIHDTSEPENDTESDERDKGSAPTMTSELECHDLQDLAQDDAHPALLQPASSVCESLGTKNAIPAEGSEAVVQQPDDLHVALPDGTVIEPPTLAEADQRPAIRVMKPACFPIDGEPLDAIQTAIRDAKMQPTAARPQKSTVRSGTRTTPIGQRYCGELTGSITGQVFCYGYAVHDGICIYVNMGGPRTSVEAIRAKLSKGDIVTVVPDDMPAVELTAGDGNTGMYTDYLQTIPEARFTSLILLHDWVIHPDYGGAATTFLFRVDEVQARAQLKQHVTRLINLPVFDDWTDYLWTAGQSAMLVRPTRSEGGIDLLTVSLDATAWTRLITGGIEQQVITLPDIR